MISEGAAYGYPVDISEVGEGSEGIVQPIPLHQEAGAGADTERVVSLQAGLLKTVARAQVETPTNTKLGAEREIGVVVIGHIEIG